MEENTSGTMETESESWTDSVAASGKSVLTSVEDGMGTVGRATWSLFNQLPGHGALIGGAVGLGAVMLVGVGELAVTVFAGYVSYRVFAYGESWTEAVENVIKFQKGALPKDEIDKPVLE
jgi:hypothetical protein